jgi:hypothetical protein
MNTKKPPTTRRLVGAGALIALALLLALSATSGCSAPGRPDRKAVAIQPTLVAETTFFADALAARVRLQPFALPMGGPGSPGGGKGTGGGRRAGGPPGGGMGGMGGPPPDGDGMEEGARPMRPMMSAPPRLSLHVAFTNRSQETLEFSPRDVICDLGNFGVRPERLALAPGQTAEIDPMSSNFPMVIKELSVELRVKRGTESETRTVRLQPAATNVPALP